MDCFGDHQRVVRSFHFVGYLRDREGLCSGLVGRGGVLQGSLFVGGDPNRPGSHRQADQRQGVGQFYWLVGLHRHVDLPVELFRNTGGTGVIGHHVGVYTISWRAKGYRVALYDDVSNGISAYGQRKGILVNAALIRQVEVAADDVVDHAAVDGIKNLIGDVTKGFCSGTAADFLVVNSSSGFTGHVFHQFPSIRI